jgi:YggT family protein
MSILFLALYLAITLFIVLMLVRLILDFVVGFRRDWRPTGLGLVAAEIVYTITDPPIKLVRRIVPPLRFGGLMFDFGWGIVMLVAVVLSYVIGAFLR